MLRRYRRAVLLRQTLLRTSQAVACAGAIVVASCAFDRLVDVPGGWRAPLPWLTLAVLCGLLACAMAVLVRPPDYDAIAHELDRLSGDRRDHLRTVLDLSRGADSENFFARASCESASARWHGIATCRLVPTRGAARWAAACVAGMAIAAAVWHVPSVRARLLWTRFCDPLGNYMRPTATWFEIDALTSGPFRSGDELAIRAHLAGRPVASPSPLISIAYDDGTTVTRRLDRDNTGMHAIVLRQLQRSFRWHLCMGPVRSAMFSVPVLPRPTVTGITVTCTYPRYSRIKDTTEELHGRTIAVLAGTKVKLKIRSNVDLARAEGATDDDVFRFRIARANPREAVLYQTVNENRRMKITLTSADGVESKHELPIAFRAIADNPPSVSILNDLDGKSFFLTDVVEIAYRAQDDLGLAALYVKSVPDDPRQARDPAIVSIDLPRFGAASAEGTARIPVAELYRSGARFLRVSLQANDTKDQDGLSPVVTLTIASDSFDRQLRFLLRSYTGRPNSRENDNGLNSLQTHEQRLMNLKNARNRITILADALEPSQPPRQNQKDLVEQVRRMIASLRLPFHYGTPWFTDFQSASLLPRFREMGEYANFWSYLAFSPDSLVRQFETALTAPDPKASLQRLAAELDATDAGADGGRPALPNVPDAGADADSDPTASRPRGTRRVPLHATIELESRVTARVVEDHRQVVRELTGYLASVAERELTAATEQDWQDGNFLVNLRSAMKEVHGYITSLLKDDLGDAAMADAIGTAAAADSPRANLEAAAPALHALVPALQAAASSALQQRIADAPVSPQALLESAPLSQETLLTIASALIHGGDNYDTDELFLFENALCFLADSYPHAGADGIHPDPVGADADSDPTASRPDPGTRRVPLREQAAFRLFQALMRARARIESLRLGVCTGQLPPGSPEAEAGWLAVRESRFELMEALALQAERADDAARLVAKIAPFAAWQPAAEIRTADFLELLRSCEQECERLAVPLEPDVQRLLGMLDARAASAVPLIIACARDLREDAAAEIAFFEQNQENEFGNLEHLKVRLAALATASLKMLDLAVLAAFHGSGGQADIGRLDAIFAGLSKILQHFDLKIESMFWTHRYGLHETENVKSLWRGKVAAYQVLERKLDALLEIAGHSGNDLAAGAAENAADELQITNLLQAERRRYQDVLALADRLKATTAQPAGFDADSDDAVLIWEQVCCLLHVLRGRMQQPGAENAPIVDELETLLKAVKDPPREVRDLPALLAQCRQPVQAAADLQDQLDAALADLASLLPPVRQTLDVPAARHEAWTFNVDWSSLERAKIRARQRLITDGRMLNRKLVSLVLNGGAPSDPAFAWARGEVEINRRKAGLALNRNELGGVALVGTTTPVDLPDHIYRELKRSREGAMPPLFRDQCYRYLNLILERAKK